MPRQSVTFTAPQMEWLQKESAELGISVGEMVRRVIDDERASDSQHMLRKITRQTLKQSIASQRTRFIKGLKNA